MITTCKLGENGCWNDGKCRATSNCENKIVTHADRIRAMSDEELGEFLYSCEFCNICEEGCDNCKYNGKCERRLVDWLKQPAEV